MKIPFLKLHILTTKTLKKNLKMAADNARKEEISKHAVEMTNYKRLTNKQLSILLNQNYKLRNFGSS